MLMNVSIRIKTMSYLLITSLLYTSIAAAQDELPIGGINQSYTLDHEFLAEDGTVVVVGQLQSLAGSSAIINAQGKEMKFNLKQFSKAEQNWIRRQSAEIKKRESKRAEITKLGAGLFSNKPATIIKTCNRLKTYGPLASQMAIQLDPHIRSADKRTRMAAFICLISISEPNAQSIRRIVDELNRNPALLSSFKNQPTKILTPFARFGVAGLPYLRAVAFSGQLGVKAADQSEVEAELNLDTARASTRLAACRSIAASGGGEEAADILLEVLAAEDGSDPQGKNIPRLIQALGKLGFQSDSVLDAIESHVSDAPEEAKEAIEQISKANPDK